MSFIKNKISGINKRIQSAKYGLFYFGNKQFKLSDSLKVNGKKTNLQFIDIKDEAFITEFSEICLYDIYKLAYLKKQVSSCPSIIDIGANQGMFLLAARQHFPNASITGYEPNPGLQAVLSHNAKQLGATVYYEAVTRKECRVNLHLDKSDLATTTSVAENGEVAGTAFKKVIERAGAAIDIVKMDCEGAEWELMEDIVSWRHIKCLALEYHLWAKPESTVDTILHMLEQINFQVTHHNILSGDQGIVIAVNKKNSMAK